MRTKVGKILGKIISFGYIIYFIYICSEQLRHFGDLMITIAYLGTPIIIISNVLAGANIASHFILRSFG